jgi:hypothetical protein
VAPHTRIMATQPIQHAPTLGSLAARSDRCFRWPRQDLAASGFAQVSLLEQPGHRVAVGEQAGDGRLAALPRGRRWWRVLASAPISRHRAGIPEVGLLHADATEWPTSGTPNCRPMVAGVTVA